MALQHGGAFSTHGLTPHRLACSIARSAADLAGVTVGEITGLAPLTRMSAEMEPLGRGFRLLTEAAVCLSLPVSEQDVSNNDNPCVDRASSGPPAVQA